jgi:adenine-specific DNA-methyltransferase
MLTDPDHVAGKERYGLTWPGKSDCVRTIRTPSYATLKPAQEESVDWASTENLFIEGDNLEALKLLQKSYYGKVKMIYIDPPYNTGKDFIYPDNYSESLGAYLRYTGQLGGKRREARHKSRYRRSLPLKVAQYDVATPSTWQRTFCGKTG